jgi:hypothetical protein
MYMPLFNLKYLTVLLDHEEYFKDGVYFLYYFDFRGRIYADSPVSYTFNKLARWLYFYGFYSEEECMQLEKSLLETDFNIFFLILNQTSLKKDYPSLDLTRTLVKYYVVTIFIELGKAIKSTAVEKYGGRLRINDLIQLGIDYYNNPNLYYKELENIVEFAALTDVFQTLAEGRFAKIPIYKDATASAIQLLMILLGVANKQVALEGNLLNDGC